MLRAQNARRLFFCRCMRQATALRPGFAQFSPVASPAIQCPARESRPCHGHTGDATLMARTKGDGIHARMWALPTRALAQRDDGSVLCGVREQGYATTTQASARPPALAASPPERFETSPSPAVGSLVRVWWTPAASGQLPRDKSRSACMGGRLPCLNRSSLLRARKIIPIHSRTPCSPLSCPLLCSVRPY